VKLSQHSFHACQPTPLTALPPTYAELPVSLPFDIQATRMKVATVIMLNMQYTHENMAASDMHLTKYYPYSHKVIVQVVSHPIGAPCLSQ